MTIIKMEHILVIIKLENIMAFANKGGIVASLNGIVRKCAAALALAGLAIIAPANAQEKMETLNIAIASTHVVYGPVWIALADNLFEKNGVKVTVVNTAALTTGPALLVSGSTDLLVSTTFLGLRISLEGKPLSVIYNLSDMSARGNAFVGKTSIKSMAQLAAMGNDCRVLLGPKGSGSWAIYQGIATQYKLKCNVSHAGTAALVAAGALSSQFDAATLNPQDAYNALDAGKVNMLLDPIKMTDAQASLIYPYQHPVSTVFGVRNIVAAKREAVTRFIKALRQADDIIAKSTPQQLAELCKQLPDVFGTTPMAGLALQWQLQKNMTRGQRGNGFIAKEDWNNLLAAAPAVWGFANLNINEPTLKYTNNVDMSYFNAAK